MKSLLSLSLLLTAALTVSACRGQKSDIPPVHPVLNMDFQQYYRPQAKNEWFVDQRSARTLEEHTVARGHAKLDKELYLGRGNDGRLIDGLPKDIQLDEALLARGEERYDIFCAPCHAEAGDGEGIIVKNGLQVPPPSYFESRLQAMPLGYIYEVIKDGYGTMKPYADQVPVADRWAIAAWVRTLQVAHRASAADLPTEERQRLEGETP